MYIRLIVTILLLMLLSPRVMAQTDTAVIRHLEKEMYRLYNTTKLDSFLAVTDQLKELTLKAGDERLFYKAWCNQALFYSRTSSRKKALETVEAVRDYADSHGSKYGLFSSSSASASILSSMRLYDQAETLYKRAIDYLHRYFPDESAAVCYLGLAKLYFNQKKNKEVMECCDQALVEPGVIPLHQLNALSYKCLTAYNTRGEEEFIRLYEEREKLRMQLGGIVGPLDRVLLVYLAECKHEYQKMLSLALAQPKGVDRLSLIARAYALCGDYKSAYKTYMEYKSYSDSVNTDEIRRESTENALQLDVARAESETKDLRIKNQRMWMTGGVVVGLLTIMFLTIYLLRRRRQLKLLREAYDRLEETTSAKERIESELRIARDIQMSMVPSVFPAFPERSDIDLYANMVPAREVGGDLYDFFMQNDRLYFCVGDVSGKGVPASMTMAVAVNLFRTIAKEGFPPEYIATKINDTLSSDNENSLFVTMFIGMVDMASGRLDFCNAGHNPPLLGTSRSDRSSLFDYRFLEMESNAPLGLWPGVEYVGEHIDSIKGHPFFVYTDGVNEAENTVQEQFGDDRMLRLITHVQQPLGERSPKTFAHFLVDEMKHAVERFVDGAPPSDDMTMFCLVVK